MLIETVFLKDYRCFKKDEKIVYHPGVNILVGDQGTGKSTLLYLLANSQKTKEIAKHHATQKMAIRYFDFEKHNLRTSAVFSDSISHMAQAAMLFSSHGETNKNILRPITEEFENCLLLLDEPDMALSIRSIKGLIRSLRITATKNNQIIVTAHNPFLIKAFSEVLSLEHKQWMLSDGFIKYHLQ